MSGIFGIYEPGRELSRELLLPMLDAHVVPGESAHDLHGAQSIAFGVSRRWNFQQVAVVKHLLVAADADLVDIASLAQTLALPANAASNMTVAELIARLYLSKGPDFLKFLHGAFSIALWDAASQRLILAIDRMGIRSLYYRREADRVLFASRISGIRASQAASPQVNSGAVLQFLLFSAIPAPLTSDTGTEKLRPGTSVTFSARGVAEHQYWDFDYAESDDRSVSRWSGELRDAMRHAVHRHLEGCPQPATGCYLSGGTDSSSVVAFASEVHRPVHSFSIAFQEAAFNELEFARTTAGAFHTDHHEKILGPHDAAHAVEKIITHFDEPFANSSAVGSYYCALLAREQGIDTLLAGDGGDELFAGNARYAQDAYFSAYFRLPSWMRSIVVEPLLSLLPSGEGKLSLPRKYVRRANIPNPRRILSYGFFLSSPPAEIFESDFLQSVGAEWLAIPEKHYSRAKASSDLNRILYLDMKMTLADNDLRKVSGTAEIAGVNVRYPLLDTRLAELSGRIPARLKLKGFEKRYIFKQAMKDILPAKVLYKKKHGFGVPLAQWLLQEPRMKELLHDVMHDSRTRQRGVFRPEFFDRISALHAREPNFYGEIVWYLLALELWQRQHLEKSRAIVHAL